MPPKPAAGGPKPTGGGPRPRGAPEGCCRRKQGNERNRQTPCSPARFTGSPPHLDDANAGQRGDRRRDGDQVIGVEESGHAEEPSNSEEPEAPKKEVAHARIGMGVLG